MKKTYIRLISAVAIAATIFTACDSSANVYETSAHTGSTAVEETTETTSETTRATTQSTVKETTASSSDTSVTTTTTAATSEVTAFGTLDDINRVCSVKANVETNSYVCTVDVNGDNPYDVTYDYGSEYQAYVDACDWKLVFDVDYYKATFPMLAIQYHNDDALLLKHFQTVGVHEGRQGNSRFNVCAYANNCSDKVYNAFGRNFAAYFIYYMMNHGTEKNVNTVTRNDGKTAYQQMSCAYTALQTAEFNRVNEYRSAVNVEDVVLNSELSALANYRAYLNAHDGYKAHDWAINNDPLIKSYLVLMGSTNDRYGENTVEQHSNHHVVNYAMQYKLSEPHYELMISGEYNTLGVSNLYYSDAGNVAYQFDVYALDLHTPI